MSSTPRRPGPLRWLLYAFGAGLPAEYKDWVLHDVSVRTWQLRHLARTCVQIAPIAILLFVFIPGPVWVRALAVLSGLILGFFYSLAYMYETAEHRAVKAGWPLGTAAGTRDADKADEIEAERERYNQRWRTELPPN
ncbi:MAG: DUF5313 family protein [Pseudonocardia sp.]|uniref:DUF5313 family protein n=1 Tax=unclassified Pseudonocardia TaxID=2619320 RepID=UPI00086980E3|nr:MULTISPECIES: DUF5313 family protein [unclassified Pseudonocardia]MBN9113428.1 DUF5313 family protein [Pseudonocardia sp.]ODU11340.1 MAG: hypothetical protein ABS80_22650 [Pseudonocardia sp. SCN 72-51]ODU99289.1 MAG: hypothetical protein ABT15_32080 [Pseudonocardia sp. SCN 73-27]